MCLPSADVSGTTLSHPRSADVRLRLFYWQMYSKNFNTKQHLGSHLNASESVFVVTRKQKDAPTYSIQIDATQRESQGSVSSEQYRRDGAREVGTNYRGPDVRKGDRGPTMLHMFSYISVVPLSVGGPDSAVGISTRYGLEGPRIESRWGGFTAPVQTGPRTHPASYAMGTGSFPGVNRPGMALTTHPHLAPRLKKE